jgi:hypothetical protein
MCASAAWARVQAPPASLARVARIVIAGAALGAFSAVAFAAAHAWFIVPIWRRVPGAIPSTGIALTAFLWAIDETAGTGPMTIARGVRCGIVWWTTLLPLTIVDNAVRLAGRRLDSPLEMAAAMSLTIVASAIAGSRLTRRRAGVAAWMFATLALMVVSGGPLPFVRSPRGAAIALAILPICAIAGALASSLRPWLDRSARSL